MRSGISTAAAERAAERGPEPARLALGSLQDPWVVDADLERELAKTASTWEALQRLGVRSGAELPIDFYFESAGPLADRRLAEFLSAELGYDAEAEAGGVYGRTPAVAMSPELLDRWVYEMFLAGYQCGGCRFAGWSATVSRP